MKEEIRNCFTWYANRISETVQYTSWSDKFCREEVKEATDRFLKELEKYIDWNNLTIQEATELRFMKWSNNLYLLPLYPIILRLFTISLILYFLCLHPQD